ncbi:MAG: peptidoglycan-binding domain-containing protein [Deltaproteobacteria bacterium]|nr:peptidoglycan-binding domain-containing protein [Deltaproteobacteria bacterium]
MLPETTGPIVTLWHGDGIDSAWLSARDLLLQAKPQTVQLHTWSPRSAADSIKHALPGTSLVCGFGIDGIARDVTKRRLSVTEGVRLFVRLAERAQTAGAIAVKWNAEAAWKRPPNSNEATLLRELVRAALAEVAARFPSLQQWHTAYDHPTFHSTYNWADWLGPNSPIVASFPQVYAAPGDGLMAHRGALPARETRALSSWRSAIRAGWIVADDPSTALREGVSWRPYYQLHHVSARDTISSAITHECVALWAAPSRMDREGKTAFLALCELHRRGFWSAEGLRGFQASAGLAVDGIWGPNTARALGVA